MIECSEGHKANALRVLERIAADLEEITVFNNRIRDRTTVLLGATTAMLGYFASMPGHPVNAANRFCVLVSGIFLVSAVICAAPVFSPAPSAQCFGGDANKVWGGYIEVDEAVSYAHELQDLLHARNVRLENNARLTRAFNNVLIACCIAVLVAFAAMLMVPIP